MSFLQGKEKGRMRVHHINNVNRVLDVLARNYNVSHATSMNVPLITLDVARIFGVSQTIINGNIILPNMTSNVKHRKGSY